MFWVTGYHGICGQSILQSRTSSHGDVEWGSFKRYRRDPFDRLLTRHVSGQGKCLANIHISSPAHIDVKCWLHSASNSV